MQIYLGDFTLTKMSVTIRWLISVSHRNTMGICIYIYIDIQMFTHTHIYLHTYTYNLYIYIFIYNIYLYSYVNLYLCLYRKGKKDRNVMLLYFARICLGEMSSTYCEVSGEIIEPFPGMEMTTMSKEKPKENWKRKGCLQYPSMFQMEG